ncbi:MAG TPA: hypothetical protein VGK01_19045 [Candidatus Angelobacter sp.]|jgi:hypothetical protein
MKKAFIAVFLITLLATIFFFLNYGFGAGHGPYDRALGILALPWILIPWPDFLFKNDLVWLVLLPLVLNLLVVLVVGKLVLRHAPRKP